MDPRFLMTIERQQRQELHVRAARRRLAAEGVRRERRRDTAPRQRRRLRLRLRPRRPRTA